jgi:hypothetical protein
VSTSPLTLWPQASGARLEPEDPRIPYRSGADPCLYVDVKQSLYITIWVDDLLIVGKDERDITNVKGKLASEFEMKDLGRLEYFLGMRISRENGNISIDQNGYIRQILERFRMEDAKPVSTPIAAGSHLVKGDPDGEKPVTKAEINQYQAMVGSLMYAMLCTRPDLAYAVQQLSQFNSILRMHISRQRNGFSDTCVAQ